MNLLLEEVHIIYFSEKMFKENRYIHEINYLFRTETI